MAKGKKTPKSVLKLESPPTVCVAVQQSLNFSAARGVFFGGNPYKLETHYLQ